MPSTSTCWFAPGCARGRTKPGPFKARCPMFRRLLIAAALASSCSAFAAACTRTSDLGAMGPTASRTFGNSFNGEAQFSECWDFSVSSWSNVSGNTAAVSADFWFLPRFIDVQEVSLWDLATGMQIGSPDLSPETFAFTGLAAGTYELVVSGFSTLGFGTASYSATLTTSRVDTVPEPSMAGLLFLAFGAAVLAGRGRR